MLGGQVVALAAVVLDVEELPRSLSKLDHPDGDAACTVLANQPLCQIPGYPASCSTGVLAGVRRRILEAALKLTPSSGFCPIPFTVSGGSMPSRSYTVGVMSATLT